MRKDSVTTIAATYTTDSHPLHLIRPVPTGRTGGRESMSADFGFFHIVAHKNV